MQGHELWQKIRNGDRAAFEKLYNDYYAFLFAEGFRICGNKEQVKDCLHEILLGVWVNRGKLPLVTYVGIYLRTAVRRKIMAVVKKNIASQGLSQDDRDSLQVELSYEALLIQLEEDQERKEKIVRALSALTTAQRQAIEMKFFRSMSYDQIAQVTGASSRTIYNQVYEALKLMRRMLRVLFML